MAKRRTGSGRASTKQTQVREGANRALSEDEWNEYFDAIDDIKDQQKKYNAGKSGEIAAQFNTLKKMTGFSGAHIKQKYRRHAFDRAEQAMLDGMSAEEKGRWEALSDQLGQESGLGAWAKEQAEGEGKAH